MDWHDLSARLSFLTGRAAGVLGVYERDNKDSLRAATETAVHKLRAEFDAERHEGSQPAELAHKSRLTLGSLRRNLVGQNGFMTLFSG